MTLHNIIRTGRKRKQFYQQKSRKNNPNDPAQFITEKHFTENGEKADKVQYVINKDQIKKEKMFDNVRTPLGSTNKRTCHFKDRITFVI